MTPFLRGMVEATVASFELPGPIAEIGSYQVPGQGQLGNLRQLFPDRPFVGMDMRPGPGVDLVENVESLSLASETIGTVLALSTLEHVRQFWKGIAEIKRVLRPDGVAILSAPFYFHIHQHPIDYWRFTPEAWESLLGDLFPQRLLGYQGPAKRPSNTWVVAFGPEYPRLRDAQLEQYRKNISALAKTPVRWGKLLRYRLGSFITGLRPFEAYLKRDHFQVELRRNTIKAASLAA
ncbi:MAG TPA: methyltransferase domain-containing protein [Gemmatales bacterium]|nr:methyltransferase domain-containing protein [Gemmatales bacterium]